MTSCYHLYNSRDLWILQWVQTGLLYSSLFEKSDEWWQLTSSIPDCLLLSCPQVYTLYIPYWSRVPISPGFNSLLFWEMRWPAVSTEVAVVLHSCYGRIWGNDCGSPRVLWSMWCISRVHPSPHRLIRFAHIKVKERIFTRPLALLVILCVFPRRWKTVFLAFYFLDCCLYTFITRNVCHTFGGQQLKRPQ